MDSNQIPQEVYDHIRLVVRSAVKEVAEQLKHQNPTTDSSIKDEDFLSAEQAAQFLKVRLNTIYAKVEKGDLPHYRSGKRKLLFSKQELADYIANRKGKTNQEICDEADDYIMNKSRLKR